MTLNKNQEWSPAIIIQENGILYELICANEVSNHYGWELTKDKKY